MCQNLGRQTKPVYFETFWLISRDPLHIFQNRFLRWNHELKPVILSIMSPKNSFFLPVKGSSATFDDFMVGLKLDSPPHILYTLELFFLASQKDSLKNQFLTPSSVVYSPRFLGAPVNFWKLFFLIGALMLLPVNCVKGNRMQRRKFDIW